MRRAAKIDDSHSEIVEKLERVGARVQSLAAIGRGCPDILFYFRGRWGVAELKDGKKSPSRRKLTEAQRIWHERFNGAPIHVWHSVDEALRAIGAI